MAKNICDHTVGILHNPVIQSEIAELLRSETLGWNNHSRTMNSLTRGNEKVLREDFTPKEFLDRRRGYMTMFNYCPYCGDKINWKEIKKSL